MHVKIQGSVEKISCQAFAYTGLVSAELTEGVKTIEDRAFFLTHLAFARLPESVRSIGEKVFGGESLDINFKIIAPEGSLAQKYAEKHGIRFQSASEE